MLIKKPTGRQMSNEVTRFLQKGEISKCQQFLYNPSCSPRFYIYIALHKFPLNKQICKYMQLSIQNRRSLGARRTTQNILMCLPLYTPSTQDRHRKKFPILVKRQEFGSNGWRAVAKKLKGTDLYKSDCV